MKLKLLRSFVFIQLLAAMLCMAQAGKGGPVLASADVVKSANADITAGKADDAIVLLTSFLATNAENAEAHNLLCRVYYQENRWHDAIAQCQLAVGLIPSDSAYHLWLGRAYGGEADSDHSVKAYPLAKKVKAEFERAVQLDSANTDALFDLGEFYVIAPGIVGGSKDKAQEIVQALRAVERTLADELNGRLEEKEKHYDAAELEFKAAIEASKQPADAWMNLASFYLRRRQSAEALEAVRAGIDADAKQTSPHGPALVDAAGILTRSHQEPQLAIQLLKLYLASSNQSEDDPAFQVHVQLSRLLEQQGNTLEAQHELEAAAALAHEYRPIQSNGSAPSSAE
jgi:tetratricopeptide (TPR) repeat protein